MPPVTSYLIEDPDPEGPFGAKEVGQGPLLPVLPALANSIFDAVGVRIDQVPIQPQMILRALAARKRGGDGRFGPDRLPDLDFGETLVVPTPAEGGDGRAADDPRAKPPAGTRDSTGTMTTREAALASRGRLTTE